MRSFHKASIAESFSWRVMSLSGRLKGMGKYTAASDGFKTYFVHGGSTSPLEPALESSARGLYSEWMLV